MRARAAADVEHGRRSRREVPPEQLLRAEQLEAPGAAAEPRLLVVPLLVVPEHVAVGHRASFSD